MRKFGAYKEESLMFCRNCENETFFLLDFGPMPLANNFCTTKDAGHKVYDLKVRICTYCWLFQIEKQPSAPSMFNERYPFFTGLSNFMKNHFKAMASYGMSLLGVEKNELKVLEIGCNDGTLLENFASQEVLHLGIDPSRNVVDKALEKKCNAIVGFFSEQQSHAIRQEFGQFNLVFAANVVCHIENIKDFFSGISHILAEQGLFIFEEPYMLDVLKKVSYDQIYDEHVFLFSITSIKNILRDFDLELIKVDRQETHGGSMRYVVAKKDNFPIDKSVDQLEKIEKDCLIDSIQTYVNFAEHCKKRKAELRNLLINLKDEGKKVYGYAATSKSTTILNYCDIDDRLISGIGDSTPEKHGKYTPGTGIPVVSIEHLRDIQPDYVILFAWNHLKEIAMKEQLTSLKKSKWVLLAPKIEVISI